MSFTPGPWEIIPEEWEMQGDRGYHEPEIAAHGRSICTIRIGIPEEEANARLIAAAPCQHEALRVVSEGVNAIIDNWAHWTDEYKQQYLTGLQTVAMDAHKKANGDL